MAKKNKVCNCLRLTNEALEREGCNTRLKSDLYLNFKSGKSRVLPVLAVEKDNPKKREQLRTIVPQFCPFCGEKYPDSE